MIKEITPDQLSPDMRIQYEEWLNHFPIRILARPFMPYFDYQGEDKNILSWQSKKAYIMWWGQSPGNEPYRHDGKHDGLLKAVNRFSDYSRRKIYKLIDSSTVWMTGEKA